MHSIGVIWLKFGWCHSSLAGKHALTAGRSSTSIFTRVCVFEPCSSYIILLLYIHTPPFLRKQRKSINICKNMSFPVETLGKGQLLSSNHRKLKWEELVSCGVTLSRSPVMVIMSPSWLRKTVGRDSFICLFTHSFTPLLTDSFFNLFFSSLIHSSIRSLIRLLTQIFFHFFSFY